MSTLKEQIVALNGTAAVPLTHKQGGLLYKLTKLIWWKTETLPCPTVPQASLLIAACLAFIQTKEGANELVEAIQIWFPDFDDVSEIHARYFPKAKDDQQEPKAEPAPAPAPKKTGWRRGFGSKRKSEPKATPMPDQQPEPKPQPEPQPRSEPKQEPQPAPKPKAKKDEKPAKGVESISALIAAGIRNIWLVGPAGCGKTTICVEAGKLSDVPVTVIACGAGTSATTFLGYKYPEREGTPFVHAFAQEGIIVLDEFTALEAQVAQIINGALANGELTSTIGTFQRHPDCVIIATSNTFGAGADRMYVSNNQLDASTNDRFVGGILEIDYSNEYEQQYDSEVVKYVWNMRKVIKDNGIRKVASTRSIIAGCQLKKAGLDWKNSLIVTWTKDEKALL